MLFRTKNKNNIPNPLLDDDPFLKTSIDLLKDMEEELLDESFGDDYTKILIAFTDLEKFVIDTYSSHMALVQLLIKKGIIKPEEFLTQKKDIKKHPEIRSLYNEVENKRKIIEKDT